MLSARQKQVEVSRHPCPNPDLSPAPQWLGTLSILPPLPIPSHSLLQEHLLPTQEAVLGEVSKNVRPKSVTAPLPGWR